MSREVLLRVERLGKCYVAYHSSLARFAEWFGVRVAHAHEFWAVRDVDLCVHRGEALALVGANGAGKSTLLKLVTGTIRPTTGTIQVAGRVSAILELGLGFNPAFSGRQNVFLAGGLMGFSTREIQELMAGIEDLAELGDFLDQPLRTYSSGMQARLAFSVATAVRPDVLIIDEILSVGDSYFQHKSFDRIRKFKEQGTALLFVTHSMSDVRALCDRVVLLDKGRVVRDGLPNEVVDYYNSMVADRENAQLTIEQRRSAKGWVTTKSGTSEATLVSMTLTDARTGAEVSTARVRQRLALCSVVAIREPVERLVMGHLLRDKTGHAVWGTNTWHTGQVLEDLKPGQVVKFRFEFDCNLGPGSYGCTYNLVSSSTKTVNNYDSVDNHFVFDVVNSDLSLFTGSTWLDCAVSIEVE